MRSGQPEDGYHAGMSKKRPGASSSTSSTGAASPFAALAALREQLPPGAPAPDPADAPAAAPDPAGAPAAAPARGPARAVVRYQRKGRGGKEVTVIERLELPPAELERWCRELKRALGCGGAIEGDQLVLAGDQRPRLPALLEARGVRRVTVA